jgi:hypothetical protein
MRDAHRWPDTGLRDSRKRETATGRDPLGASPGRREMSRLASAEGRPVETPWEHRRRVARPPSPRPLMSSFRSTRRAKPSWGKFRNECGGRVTNAWPEALPEGGAAVARASLEGGLATPGKRSASWQPRPPPARRGPQGWGPARNRHPSRRGLAPEASPRPRRHSNESAKPCRSITSSTAARSSAVSNG